MAVRSRFFRHPRWEGDGLTVTVVNCDAVRAVLHLAGELDLASAQTLEVCLHRQLADGRRHLRVDMSEVTFIDASGLSALVRAHHTLLELRGALVLTAMSARCRRLIDMVGLGHTLLVSDQSTGITSFRAPSRTAMVMGISAK